MDLYFWKFRCFSLVFGSSMLLYRNVELILVLSVVSSVKLSMLWVVLWWVLVMLVVLVLFMNMMLCLRLLWKKCFVLKLIYFFEMFVVDSVLLCFMIVGNVMFRGRVDLCMLRVLSIVCMVMSMFLGVVFFGVGMCI